MATAADLTWRGYMSIRVLLRYWLRASSSLPPLDLRADAPHSNTLGKGVARLVVSAMRHLATLSPSSILVSIFLSPVSVAIFSAALLYFVIRAAAGVYLLALFSYVDGCVNNAHNGTLLCANIFAVAYDHATADGDSIRLHGLHTMHERRTSNCSARLSNSAAIQATAAELMHDEAYLQAAASGDLFLLKRCLDINATAMTVPNITIDSLRADVEQGERLATVDDYSFKGDALSVRTAVPSLSGRDVRGEGEVLVGIVSVKNGTATRRGRGLSGNLSETPKIIHGDNQPPSSSIFEMLEDTLRISSIKCGRSLNHSLEDGVYDCEALPPCQVISNRAITQVS